MYIVQEQIEKDLWQDRYQSADYEFIADMYHGFREKYPNIKFRIIEVYYYV